ncbi:MAG: hypothetical protein ACR2JB_03340 [Bryobacteraceae bacterium]
MVRLGSSKVDDEPEKTYETGEMWMETPATSLRFAQRDFSEAS